MLVYSTALPGRELGKRLVLGQSSKSWRSISTALGSRAAECWVHALSDFLSLSLDGRLQSF